MLACRLLFLKPGRKIALGCRQRTAIQAAYQHRIQPTISTIHSTSVYFYHW